MDIIHMSYMRFKFPQLGLIGLMVGAKDLYHRDSGFKSGFKLLGRRTIKHGTEEDANHPRHKSLQTQHLRLKQAHKEVANHAMKRSMIIQQISSLESQQ